jgi:hypothetical protein
VFHSAEIRWFFKGDSTDFVDRWIAASGLAKEEAERLDAYLVLPGCPFTGVKIREGNFEVKAQTRASELVVYTDHVRAYRDAWVKWSRPRQDVADFRRLIGQDEHWVFVRKRRTVRLFSLESEVLTEVAPGGPFLTAGCQVEKTDLSVLPHESSGELPADEEWSRAEEWWSFCFEAFGNPGKVLAHLDTAAAHVFQPGAGFEFDEQASMSYPRWLLAL